MTRLAGSQAREAFTTAADVMAASAISPGQRPAVTFDLPPNAAAMPAPTVAWEPRGPLLDAAAALRAGTVTSRSLVESALRRAAGEGRDLGAVRVV